MTTAYIEQEQAQDQEQAPATSLLNACAITILLRAGDYCRTRLLAAWAEQNKHELGSPESARLAREARDYTDAAAKLTARRLAFLEGGKPSPPVIFPLAAPVGIVDLAPRRAGTGAGR